MSKWFQTVVVALIAMLALVGTVYADDAQITFTPLIGPAQEFEDSFTYPRFARYERIDQSGQTYSSWSVGGEMDLKKERLHGSFSFRRHELQPDRFFDVSDGRRQEMPYRIGNYHGRAHVLNANVQYSIRSWLSIGGGSFWQQLVDESIHDDGWELYESSMRNRYFGPYASATLHHSIGRASLQMAGTYAPWVHMKNEIADRYGIRTVSTSGNAFSVRATARIRITQNASFEGGYRYEDINMPNWESRTMDGTTDKIHRSLRTQGPWLGLKFQL